MGTSAELNNMYGQSALADMYAFGYGVTQDNDKAFTYYMKASDQGLSGAQRAVAISYYYGYGTVLDYQDAYDWFVKAKDNKSKFISSNSPSSVLFFITGDNLFSK